MMRDNVSILFFCRFEHCLGMLLRTGYTDLLDLVLRDGFALPGILLLHGVVGSFVGLLPDNLIFGPPVRWVLNCSVEFYNVMHGVDVPQL